MWGAPEVCGQLWGSELHPFLRGRMEMCGAGSVGLSAP